MCRVMLQRRESLDECVGLDHESKGGLCKISRLAVVACENVGRGRQGFPCHLTEAGEGADAQASVAELAAALRVRARPAL